ncbi:MAG: DUF951 domain-containing protein [Actinomycetota bacterium]|nr:DUF951 domain-containing protein [Actinomycetota bacterium]
MVEIVRINVGDIVTLKKPHPCGVNEWEVTRLGMEIGLVCRGCGRKVRLVRYDFDRRFRSYVKRVEEQDASDSGLVES